MRSSVVKKRAGVGILAVLIALVGVVTGGAAGASAKSANQFCADLTFKVPRLISMPSSPTASELRAEAASLQTTGAAIAKIGGEAPSSLLGGYLTMSGGALNEAASGFLKAALVTGIARKSWIASAQAHLSAFNTDMGLALPLEQSACTGFTQSGQAAMKVVGDAQTSAKAAKRAVGLTDVASAIKRVTSTAMPVRLVATKKSSMGFAIHLQISVKGVSYDQCSLFSSNGATMEPCS